MSWTTVNLNLIAKSLGELAYEQILHPVKTNEEYALILASGAHYTFRAWESVWNHLRVNPESIKKTGAEKITAAQFFIDAQQELEMNDIVLGNFLEEMHNSLYSDMVLFEKQKNVSVQEMVYWSGEKVQCYLNGHPKILLSKGRIGWGALELQEFAPEEEKSVNLHWIAVKKGRSLTSMISPALLDESMNESEKKRFFDVLKEHDLDEAQFDFLPVHPWQWSRFIKIQYADLLAKKEIVSLGIFGDDYLPQISIRTLSNISRPEKVDIKLPLTILNTSAIRGIPSRYIATCSELSQSVLKLCREDKLLHELGTDVLMEKAGMSVEHDHFSQVAGSPYRYRELLGAIWRESTVSKLEENELGILTGSLFYQDHEGKSLIGAYIKKSGLTKEEWLREYFRHVVIALYHLQVQYGLGLVSHGQNIILKMRNYRPAGILLKDFQGDLRLSSDSILCARDDFKGLDKLPKHYLIHDLITGHLVTVLRFISGAMEESDGFKEKDFYRILGEVLIDYQNNYRVPEELSFLKETFDRVLVNKVRFKMGYGDTSERLKPAVGTELKNPIYTGLRY